MNLWNMFFHFLIKNRTLLLCAQNSALSAIGGNHFLKWTSKTWSEPHHSDKAAAFSLITTCLTRFSKFRGFDISQWNARLISLPLRQLYEEFKVSNCHLNKQAVEKAEDKRGTEMELQLCIFISSNHTRYTWCFIYYSLYNIFFFKKEKTYVGR